MAIRATLLPKKPVPPSCNQPKTKQVWTLEKQEQTKSIFKTCNAKLHQGLPLAKQDIGIVRTRMSSLSTVLDRQGIFWRWRIVLGLTRKSSLRPAVRLQTKRVDLWAPPSPQKRTGPKKKREKNGRERKYDRGQINIEFFEAENGFLKHGQKEATYLQDISLWFGSDTHSPSLPFWDWRNKEISFLYLSIFSLLLSLVPRQVEMRQ